MTARHLSSIIFAASLAVCASPAAAQLYDLPFKAEDFADDERVYWGRDIHGTGVQTHGYDLDSRRYHEASRNWLATLPGGTRSRDWLVYGKPVYAMRAGTVIACWRNAPDNPGPGAYHTELGPFIDADGEQRFRNARIYGGGNGFWIEHNDGSRAEYAHFRPGSVPAELCPHHAALLPQTIDTPNVRLAWPHIRVPANQQVRVERGQFLGRAGNSGTSSNPHLHIHLEAGGRADTKKENGQPRVIRFARGLFASESTEPYGRWASFAGNPIPAGPVLVWPSRTVFGQYARHAYPASRYGALFTHLADSGYRLSWIDTYRRGRSVFINHVWRPADGPWRAFHLLSENRYQQVVDDAIDDGFEPVHVESSLGGGGGIRYSVVFAKNQPGSFIARHGLSAAQHQALLDDAAQRGFSPVSISVVSIGGRRSYTVLYRTNRIGSWVVRSSIRESDYQTVYDRNAEAGRRPTYVNAYMHDGQPLLSVIFASKRTSTRKDRHALSSSGYQQEFENALDQGLLTRIVTSFDGAASQHRFAASWWKDRPRPRPRP